MSKKFIRYTYDAFCIRKFFPKKIKFFEILVKAGGFKNGNFLFRWLIGDSPFEIFTSRGQWKT